MADLLMGDSLALEFSYIFRSYSVSKLLSVLR